MKRVSISEKRFKQILLGTWCFSIGIIFAVASGNLNPTINYEFTEITYISPSVTDNVTNDYSNGMVRDAINFSNRYVCDEPLFKSEQYPGWLLWKDYEDRVTDASYNYWIISYSFGIWGG